ncbi:enoyl-CoA hydratase/isomerase family protein [Halorussus salinisoli]|uniref:enoyl-CoA hydratase/isomerase family protein n=1 Tax=Halorussus salinisoli TaxID=2558242 RepID=UPI001484FA1E|nr:enoyl-CoA hydratase/isomerase family protein [Halorussus salinisoli]
MPGKYIGFLCYEGNSKSQSAFDTIRLDQEDNVATLTLDRPPHLNSLTQQMTDELLEAVTQLRDDNNVRCIVLTGEGDAFGADADLSQLDGDAGDEPVIRQLASTLHEVILQLYYADKPVVTGVNGTAAGAGFSLAGSVGILLN